LTTNVALFAQVYNEVSSGHLRRFLNWNLDLVDYLCVFDDGSDDGTLGLLKGTADILVQRDFNSFRDEQLSRARLLGEIHRVLPDCKFLLWLDADEVLYCSRTEIDEVIDRMAATGLGGLRLPHLNLWRSNYTVRLDGGYSGMQPVRLWRNSRRLTFSAHQGLHQTMHPRKLGRIGSVNVPSVVHYGFASDDLLIKKYQHYKNNHQEGWPLHRLIDESGLQLAHIDQFRSVLGSRFPITYALPPQIDVVARPRIEWEIKANDRSTDSTNHKRPLVTLTTLIFQGVDWLEFIYGELNRLAMSLPQSTAEVLVVANNATEDILRFLKANGIPYQIAPDPSSENHEWYINSVYRAYNHGVLRGAGEFVLLVNSDMGFAEGFLPRILESRTKGQLIAGRLVEVGVLRSGTYGVEKYFGFTPKSYARRRFESYARRLVRQTENGSRRLQTAGLFMPLLVNRNWFVSSGGFPPGNLPTEELDEYVRSGHVSRVALQGESCVPGDAAYFRRQIALGARHLTDFSAVSYHFQEGEKRSRKAETIRSGIAIINQSIDGINGEEVLWRAIGRKLEQRGIRVVYIDGGNRISPIATAIHFRRELRKLGTPPRLILSNSSYSLPLPRKYRHLVIRQDAPSGMTLRLLQKLVRTLADSVVSNDSDFVAQRTRERRVWLPIPLADVWSSNAPPPRMNRHAIFVGAFSEAKGWPRVRDLVSTDLSVFWTLVSKYGADDHGLGADSGTNWRVLRQVNHQELCALLDEASIFVIASPYETQCLAALEAASRNLPVVMPPTGLLGTLPQNVRQRVGEFGEDLPVLISQAFARLKSHQYQPREVVDELGLIGENRYQAWENYLLTELRRSFVEARGQLMGFKENFFAMLLTPVWRLLKVVVRTYRIMFLRLREPEKNRS